jgi:hypothetical protein
MPQPIFTCAICGNLVTLEECKVDAVGMPVHEDCYAAKVAGTIPEYIAISPMTLRCPRCKADPGEVCEVLLDQGLEIVHVERIKAAIAFDITAKERFDRARISSKPAE